MTTGLDCCIALHADSPRRRCYWIQASVRMLFRTVMFWQAATFISGFPIIRSFLKISFLISVLAISPCFKWDLSLHVQYFADVYLQMPHLPCKRRSQSPGLHFSDTCHSTYLRHFKGSSKLGLETNALTSVKIYRSCVYSAVLLHLFRHFVQGQTSSLASCKAAYGIMSQNSNLYFILTT